MQNISYACYFCIFHTRTKNKMDFFRTKNKMDAKGTKQVRESAAVSDCTEISCVRKVGEPRIRKLSAYEIFWIHSIHFFLEFV